MERVTGIGPVSATWQAAILPLNYTRNYLYFNIKVPQRGNFVGVPRLELGTSSSQTRRSTI
jgi:hypothetical protein